MKTAAVALIAAAAALAMLSACKAKSPEPAPAPRETAEPRAISKRPTLLLLTTLPLMFGESFGLESNGSSALKALETRYVVRPISVADAKTLAQNQLLLMAHPLAQPAEALVDLDAWVRRGGRLLLLADPALDWHSALPLGDARRPPPAFADTGLLGHWGLRLDAPDERGPTMRRLRGHDVLTASSGELVGKCAVSGDRLVSRCRIGCGQVTVVADADFRNGEDLDGPTEHNLGAMLAELAALERP